MRTRTPTLTAAAAAAALLLSACATDGDDAGDAGVTTEDGATEDGAADDATGGGTTGTDDAQDGIDGADEDAADVEQGDQAGLDDGPASTQPTAEGITRTETDLGEHVADTDGRTYYTSILRGDDDPCIGDCAQLWPPALVDGDPVVGDGVDDALVGTMELENGGTQLTYDGNPLHFYRADEPGDTRSQGLVDEWFVVGIDGALIGAPDDIPDEDDAGEDADEGDEDA